MRSLTTRNLLDKKPGETVRLSDELAACIGEAERKGCWLIYGYEKNGKTTFALMLSKTIAQYERVAYISAEEGTDKSFKDACLRAGITADDNILWDEYLSVDDLVKKFQRPRTPNIIVVDNLTIYADELKPTEVKKRIMDALPQKLLIFLGHEERKSPYPATARMASKYAKVIFHVVGLKAIVTSRFGNGGELVIDEENSELFYGQ
ncbi:hypothetical protein AGMMS4956_09620 [Bacteroidia bacterium]|nr:hypothetical protein AGMMS4956_09620 [Bacteroidia bacterium]